MVYHFIMSTLTSYSNHSNYVITFTSAHSDNFRSHDTLISGIGSDSDKSHSIYVSRRRAFERASAIIYCYKDILNCFVTLTYKHQHSDYSVILNDLKNAFTRQGVQYIAVVEKHKSGKYHVHAITTTLPDVVSLRKGKYSYSKWTKGFSDVKFISGVDDKFRIEKYIFKYMTKSDKIGGRWFLKSRGLKVFRTSYPQGVFPRPHISDKFSLDFYTYNIYNINDISISVKKEYYERIY